MLRSEDAGDVARPSDRIPLPVPRWARLTPEAVAIRWHGASITYEQLAERADAWAARLGSAGLGAGDRVAVWMPNRPLAVTLVHAAARLSAIIVPLNTRLTAREVGRQLERTRPRILVADPSLEERVRQLDPEITSRLQVLVVAPSERLEDLPWVDGPSPTAERTAIEPPSTRPPGAEPRRTEPPSTETQGGGPPVDVGKFGGAEVDGLEAGIGTEDGRTIDGLPVGDATLEEAKGGASPRGQGVLRSAVRTDRPQSIIHTSGTTGRAKGVVLTWGNQAWSATGSAIRLGSESGIRWLATLPWFHVGGLAIILRCAWQGGTVVLHPGFDPEAVDRALDEEAVTALSVVPTMLSRLLAVRGERGAPDSLRAVLVGGGPAAPALLERAADLGFPLAPTYGLTEAASQAATCAPGWRPEDGLAAPPMPFTDVRIVDVDGLPVADGEPGRIALRGPTVMAGYWDDPQGTAAVLDDDGWLHTGDRGYLDDRWHLVVLGRADDVIVSGGENVDPVEVEAMLDAHPRVDESCVFGVDDPEWGRKVVAALVLREPVDDPHRAADDGQHRRADDDEQRDGMIAAIDDFVRAKLAGYKVPREMRIVEALPRTASGKVRRDAVRRAWSDGSSDHGAGAAT